MAALTHQCPHCLVQGVSLQVVAQTGTNPSYVHLSCPLCGKPSSAQMASKTNFHAPMPPISHLGQNLGEQGWIAVKFWPDPPAPEAPKYLPDPVQRAYIAAERNFPHEGMEEASAGSYRRALDVGTKMFAAAQPEAGEYESKNLNTRIDMLRARNRLTPELADWSHQIRGLGNDAMHELDEITRPELEALRGFTEMVLTYVFTLPGMLVDRQTPKRP